jgi:hypothetical protein
LKKGERCWYVAFGREGAIVEAALRKKGIDVEAEMRRGALDIKIDDAAYLSAGEFHPEATVRTFSDAIESALADGFQGFRAAADMSWALSLPDGTRRVIAYEALLKSLFATSHVTGMCLYHRAKMPLQVLNGALVTHPLVAMNSHVHANPFYDANVRSLDAIRNESVTAKIDTLERTAARRRR